ncbi:hypothetical protein [Azohydromonas lata]|uniref:hypothetical protein n=1 Tax=Azohydromonas lata TaxID=45677 RepID=UPI00082E89C6|nr:hypothetical protein [Azohydromonas lata]
MPDTFDPRPPQELRAFYDWFAARYCAPGVRLSGFRLRWIAYRSEELDRGIGRAVLDLAWGEENVTRQVQFVARALEEVQGACALTFVEVGLGRVMRGSADGPLAPVVLKISMWHSNHPCGLLGRIELDAQGRPTGSAHAPLPLLCMAG